MFYQVSVTVWWLLLSKPSSLLSWRLLSHKDFPGGSDGKETASNVRDPGVIAGSGRSLEKRMATHSSILGLFWWLRQQRICLQCKRPKFDPWARKIPWRRKWQPTPVFLAGEFHGQRSLAGYSSWGHKESEITELLTLPISPFFPLTSQCLLPREFTSKLYFKKLGIWFEIIKVEKFNTWTNSITRLWVRENEVKEKWEKEVNFLSYKEILVIKKSTE